MKKLIVVFMSVVFCLSLCACGSTETQVDNAEPLNLMGNWEEKNKGEAYQAGFIDDTSIEIFWIMDDGTQALYWSGTYEKPDNAGDSYTWESQNNKAKTETALLASLDDSKVFSYANGELSYEVSVMGTTKTVKLIQSETDYSSIGTVAGDSDTQVYKDLELNNSGYTIINKGDYNYIYYAVEISNPNPDTAVEYPTIEITAKNDDGAILRTETQTLMGIAAGDSFLYGNGFIVEGGVPTNVEISVASPDDYDFVPQEGSDIIHTSTLAISNVSEIDGDNKRYTGEVTNNSSVDLNSICVCVVYKKGAEIVGGDTAFVDSVAPGTKKAFEISTYNSFSDYTSFEIVALQW